MHSLYPRSNQAEEIWVLFDCRIRGTRNRLWRERRAWGQRATIENLGNVCAVLMVRPGGTREISG
jgi:hypothetical protein